MTTGRINQGTVREKTVSEFDRKPDRTGGVRSIDRSPDLTRYSIANVARI